MPKTTMLYGKRFYTDNQKLSDYLDQIIETGVDCYKYDEAGFDREFPGVRSSAVAAIQSLEINRVRVYSIVYINGIMQAWAMYGFGDPDTGLPLPPGKLCPNKHLYPVEL